MFIKTKSRKNEDGEIEIAPRNIQTRPGHKGGGEIPLFSVPSKVFMNGETYTGGGAMKMRDSKPITTPAEHDRAFKPTRHVN